MQTILSYGMGVESTAILVRWLEDASVRPCRLDELIVITSHTGDEYADTYRDVETYVLPLLRKHRVRYVQVARATDEVVVVRDIRYVYRQRCATRYPTREEFLVATPAVVESKARYGLEWFEEQWNRRQQELFPWVA
jgi:hypothetical protein